MPELQIVLSATNEDDVNKTGVVLTTDVELVVAADLVKLFDDLRSVELVEVTVVEVVGSFGLGMMTCL